MCAAYSAKTGGGGGGGGGDHLRLRGTTYL